MSKPNILGRKPAPNALIDILLSRGHDAISMGKENYAGSEHRRAIRFAISDMVELTFGRENSVRARGVDISSTGAMCKATLPVDIGAQITMRCGIPIENGSKSIECRGKVVRCDLDEMEFKIAVEFDKIAAADKKFIEEYASQI